MVDSTVNYTLFKKHSQEKRTLAKVRYSAFSVIVVIESKDVVQKPSPP